MAGGAVALDQSESKTLPVKKRFGLGKGRPKRETSSGGGKKIRRTYQGSAG